MITCFNNSIEASKWQRSITLISGNIQGHQRMLEMNEKLFRILKSNHYASHKQVSLVMETMAFIEKEVMQDIDELDVLADMIIDIMDKKDGHTVLSLIPTIQEIKDDCNELISRLEEHKVSVKIEVNADCV